MKIILNHFGPIEQFIFDTDKDLYLIYGENNIGKSYAISAVYLILKALKEVNLGKVITFQHEIQVKNSELEVIIQEKISQKEEKPISIDGYFGLLGNEMMKAFFIPHLNTIFNNSFPIQQLENKYGQNKLLIQIIFEKGIALSIELGKDYSLYLCDFKIHKPCYLVGNNEHFKDEVNLNDSSIDFHFSKVFFRDVSFRSFAIYVYSTIYENLFFSNEIYLLPASRSGLYQGLNVIGPILAQLSQQRNRGSVSISLPALSEPVSDYYIAISTLKNGWNPKDSILSDIISEIEQDVLKAKIEFNTQNGKIEYVNSAISLRLEVTEVSSMVSEIAPIVAYLKYIIKPQDHATAPPFLFIEEPEAHLHPKVQVLMMKLFAKLAKKGVKIVMTTHSDFMFNALGNLLLDKQIAPEKVASYHLVMGENGSYDAGDMQATAEGIDDHNFTQTLEELYNERMNLYAKNNEIL